MSKGKVMSSRRGILKTLSAVGLGSVFGLSAFDRLAHRVAAQAEKRLILVRSIFDFRNESRTHLGADLAPLAPYASRLGIATGLSHNGDGSEYHNGKQIRFATACTPENRTGRNRGGGAFNGASFDIVGGRHLQEQNGTRNGALVLGAYPYSDSGLVTTFGTVSFNSAAQHVLPEYDHARQLEAISSYAMGCGSSSGPMVDVAGLQGDNLVLEAALRDLQRSRRGVSADTRGQVELLEAQMDALRADNTRAIESNEECTPLRGSPLAHSYVGGGPVSGDFDQRIRGMNFTGAMALATGFASAVTLNYDFSGHGQARVPGYHNHTHPGGFSRPPSGRELEELDELSRFQMNMLSHLLAELSELGILDNTLVVYSPHERPTHNHRDVVVLSVNSGRTGHSGINREVQDVGRDVLSWCGVPQAGNLGGEGSRGGIIL